LDPGRVVAWGDSAGGYLAVMAGVTGETIYVDGGYSIVGKN